MEDQDYEDHLALREEKGREEGRQEGRQIRNREIARSMLAKGLDLAVIAETTGLAEAEIASLRFE